VTQLEAMLINRGNALARSIGHVSVQGNPYHCPKISSAIPCTCGAGRQQAEALDDWKRLVKTAEENAVL
jgi:hypothetical protein